ncbi:hypothetical protein LTR92_007909 [Exophiala xenobiotica]|nr:hypothetical protein LTR92_007909 [Exophiala xenobiotica]KAK5533694.1 hypothetical protein LTR23_009074 [Chaetothyriales sp. CCFEE 6169]KAK5391850.1 hypothetical protein LTR79_010648 [Exophiala xenobiotica]KAK5411437.1 hypothetical protein LTR90_007811 [Exophiala xenobiotica]KAK5433377.1 hypothetical protein LTR18_010817 [Exophiala xenobiotica]
MGTEAKVSSFASEHNEDPKVLSEAETLPANAATKSEKRFVRKLDMILLPLLALAYLLAYMLSFAVLVFGVFVCCMCSARGYGDILGLRFGVGAAEALLQATPLYLVLWYGRNELGKRIALFYSATVIAGVFAGLIAYAVQKDLEGAAKRPSWQWLFIIEGSIAIGIGLLMAACLPGFPDRIKKSWMFNNEEIELAISRSEGLNDKGAGFQPKQVRNSLLDPKTWYLAVLSGVNSTLLASTGAFLPTIIKEFGYSSVQAQLFTVIPYACAFVSMVTIGYLSDHFRNKSSFILGCLSLCATGLIILMATTGKQVGVFAACLLVMGAYPAAVLQMAWIQINFCGNTKRAMSWAVAMIFGQGLSMVGAQIYTTPPRFFKGHGILLAFVVVAMCSTVAARLTMARANKRRDEELREYEQRGEAHPDQAKSYEETCDYHVAFKYTI